MPTQIVAAQWAVPVPVRAFTTTRMGGASQGVYASFNQGDHVGDRPEDVASNRAKLQQEFDLPCAPLWLQQVHGVRVVDAAASRNEIIADASYTRKTGVVCAVLTADCLPVLLCDDRATVVAAVHCGWRSLAGGILEKTVAHMNAPPDTLQAWLGPAIGPAAFEVGEEVQQQFLQRNPAHAAAFSPASQKKYLANIYRLGAQELAACGVKQVTGGGRCTMAEAQDFYSYRRDGATGRMVSLIWLPG